MQQRRNSVITLTMRRRIKCNVDKNSAGVISTLKVKVKQSLDRPLGFQEFEAPRISIQSRTWSWKSCQPFAPATFTHQGISLILISVRDWDDSRAILRPKILSQRKIHMTPSYLYTSYWKHRILRYLAIYGWDGRRNACLLVVR
jgi:hypothetical protein